MLKTRTIFSLRKDLSSRKTGFFKWNSGSAPGRGGWLRFSAPQRWRAISTLGDCAIAAI
jgi:hypothetical protein